MLFTLSTDDGPVCIQLVRRENRYLVRSCPYTMYFPTEAQLKVRNGVMEAAYSSFGKSDVEVKDAVSQALKGKTFTGEKRPMDMEEWLRMKARLQKMWFNPEFRKGIEDEAQRRNPEVEVVWQGE